MTDEKKEPKVIQFGEEDPDRVIHKTVDAAFDYQRQTQQDEAEAQRMAEARKENEAQAEKRGNMTAQLSEDELNVVNEAVQQKRQLEQFKQQLSQAELSEDERQQYQEAVQAKEAELQEVEQAVERTVQERQLNARKAELVDAAPDLEDPDTKRRFKKWLKGQGFTENAIERETDPSAVSRAFHAFQKDEADRTRKTNRAKVAEYAKHIAPSRGGFDSPTNSEEARKRLRQTGTLMDAQAAMSIQTYESNVGAKQDKPERRELPDSAINRASKLV